MYTADVGVAYRISHILQKKSWSHGGFLPWSLSTCSLAAWSHGHEQFLDGRGCKYGTYWNDHPLDM